MKEDLTPVEKVYVRKSIEQHKLGTNKTLLKQVRGNSFRWFLYHLYMLFRFILVVLMEDISFKLPQTTMIA